MPFLIHRNQLIMRKIKQSFPLRLTKQRPVHSQRHSSIVGSSQPKENHSIATATTISTTTTTKTKTTTTNSSSYTKTTATQQ